jgi:hypothetical protein
MNRRRLEQAMFEGRPVGAQTGGRSGNQRARSAITSACEKEGVRPGVVQAFNQLSGK